MLAIDEVAELNVRLNASEFQCYNRNGINMFIEELFIDLRAGMQIPHRRVCGCVCECVFTMRVASRMVWLFVLA